jgi:lipoprotein NlpI
MQKASLYFVLLFAGWLLCNVALAQWSPDAEKCAKASGDDETIAACTRAIMSGQLSSADLAITFSNRGNHWDEKGKYDRAIADFNTALRLNPQLAEAYNNRAGTWRSKGEYDRAIADFNAALQLKPRYAQVYLNRGATRFDQGQFASAAADFSTLLWLDPSNAYGVVWGYFAQSRAGHRLAAASELAANAGRVDKAKWPAPVIGLLAGTKDVDGVLKAATDSDQRKQREQMCEAAFYVGEWHLLQGWRPEARASLEQAERDCPRGFLEYLSSSAELKRLSR